MKMNKKTKEQRKQTDYIMPFDVPARDLQLQLINECGATPYQSLNIAIALSFAMAMPLALDEKLPIIVCDDKEVGAAIIKWVNLFLAEHHLGLIHARFMKDDEVFIDTISHPLKPFFLVASTEKSDNILSTTSLKDYAETQVFY